MFFHAEDGRDYRIDNVRSVSRIGDQLLRVSLSGSDDEPVVAERAWDRALATHTKWFHPAQSGTYVVWLWYDENGVAGYNKADVIGWTLGADGFVHAVTVNGIDHGEEEIPPILHPNGRVDDSFDNFYDTVEEWFAAAKERADRKASGEIV